MKTISIITAAVFVLAIWGTQTFGIAAQQSMERQQPSIEGNPMDMGRQQVDSSAAGGRAGEPWISDEDLGVPVQNGQGQDIGRVVALAARQDEVAYLLVVKNGSQELTPIPVGATRLDLEKNAVILVGLEDADLAEAPTISIEELQKLDDPEFELQVRSYYELEKPGSGVGSEEEKPKSEGSRVDL